jgi:hypothetical protein
LARGKQELERLSGQQKLFVFQKDTLVEQVVDGLQNGSIRTIGSELIFGKLYDHIGFNAIGRSFSVIWWLLGWLIR